ncbi:MAG TPA: flagellar hook capping FlgD N-terminal domain-containing protein [Bryobacteraceae bacterium]|jgi:flagellar basal-body rod modification protein FlgD|nr:flagellar hook capping FlgD N-terminal domain-containing protein [Bryobacteraceae bacterium]
MATVNGVTGSQSGNQTNNNSNTQNTNAANDPLANENTFLTLLVSQLQNQDPTNPMDGTTFVTQLAQFSDLQQSLAIRQDTDAISTQLTGTSSLTTPTTSNSSTTGSNNGTNPSGSVS